MRKVVGKKSGGLLTDSLGLRLIHIDPDLKWKIMTMSSMIGRPGVATQGAKVALRHSFHAGRHVVSSAWLKESDMIG